MEIQKSGITVKYSDQGEGDVLILLPGTLGDEELFHNQQSTLKDRFRILVFDHPNIADLHELVDFYHTLFSELIDGDFHLGGTSVGGWIAQHYALKYPVKSLVLGNTFCDNTLLREQSMSMYKISGYAPWFYFRYVFMKKLRRDLNEYPELLPYFKNNVRKMGKKGLRQRFWWSLSPVPSVTLEGTPILLISSDDDPTVPDALTAMLRDRYPKDKVHRFPEGGHFPYLTHPDEYSRILREFLESK